MSDVEIINKDKNPQIKVVLFDFDGTISTLRQGWEGIMEPLMVEMISGPAEADSHIKQEVKEYIAESTGIQTIFQMKWLAQKVREYGLNPEVLDCWDYKQEYNRRLLKMVNERIEKLEKRQLDPGDFRIKGSLEFLQKLQNTGVEMMVASGTDHPDVIHETRVLGVNRFFKEIAGAPVDRADDSKKAVIGRLLEKRGLDGPELLIIGDGKVEISLGAERGAVTLGMATDEVEREGINDWKRERLIRAGADAIAGDFKDVNGLLSWMGLRG